MPLLATAARPEGILRDQAQPVLRTGDLVLRPWRESDVDAVVAAYADPGIQRWHVRTMTGEEALDWIESWSRYWTAERAASWAVTGPDDVPLGQVGLRQVDLFEGHAHVSYWVRPEARGKGVAIAATEAMVDWCFGAAGLHRLQLSHSTANAASCRVAGKLGFALEGTSRGAGRHADGWHDMHVHSRLRDDPVAGR
ncbi:RimJ/RimL family protein N-acetyltransferase [Hamadaea flava]|uniref:GNAT family N-acetyltransferase n=1 Tax=Hamadaea flava TaxID=1742688 RepID=A0ABV8M0N4_9ACTN|nr:GNAT family N-acetyltransferase [Hamadaea flava]MCP2328935.1 RimJ/RimL family protein N-acetyltransferase [Hamadaea flava]